jgi:hypothetical protein
LNKRQLLRTVNIAGAILSVVLVGYVLTKGLQSLGSTEVSFTSVKFVGQILLSLAVIHAATFLLPVNYAFILSRLHLAGHDSGNRYVGVVYGQTQILKYLPGNVFHFVGRQLRLGEIGIPQMITGNTSVIEMLCLVFVAATIAAISGSNMLATMVSQLGLETREIVFISLAAVAIVVAFAWILYYFNRKKISFGIKSLFVAISIHVGFFVLSGLGFWLVVNAVDPETISASQSISIFSIAWLLGTIMPGASAGIGVRETVILALGYIVAGTDLAIAAIILRLITVVADLVLWVVCAGLNKVPGYGKDSS